MMEWFYAFREQSAEWLVEVKKKCFWLPFLIGLISGSLLTVNLNPTSSLVTSWSGLIVAAILGVVVTIIVQKFSEEVDKIIHKKPLNKVLGTIAKDITTIYIAPFERPLESELHRLDRKQTSSSRQRVRGTEQVVGSGDTIALSFVYATLLKAGKPYSDIIINQDADLDREKWGMNFISIGAANARTREVLSVFENTYFCFDDNYSSIIQTPASEGVVSPTIIREKENVELKYQKKVVMEDGKDYGIILKLRDEARDEGNRIFIIAGLGGEGTAGAAFFLWRHYDRLVDFGDTFGILIEVRAGYESARMVDFDSVALLSASYVA